VIHQTGKMFSYIFHKSANVCQARVVTIRDVLQARLQNRFFSMIFAEAKNDTVKGPVASSQNPARRFVSLTANPALCCKKPESFLKKIEKTF